MNQQGYNCSTPVSQYLITFRDGIVVMQWFIMKTTKPHKQDIVKQADETLELKKLSEIRIKVDSDNKKLRTYFYLQVDGKPKIKVVLKTNPSSSITI